MTCSIFKLSLLYFSFFYNLCVASYHEQYRVPFDTSEKWESYLFNDKEYIIQDFPVTWENAKILCRGYHNGTLVIVDTKEKAEFLAEALSESQFSMDSVWVGATRDSADDPEGYRWNQGVELRRTASDVLRSESDGDDRRYPLWLNRTHIPVPEGGADCVALERVVHDEPVFLDLPCSLEKSFVCERDAKIRNVVAELQIVRCKTGLYHVYDGKMTWYQAAAHCVFNKMSLANIDSMDCLKKLGMTMLRTRPSIENAWIGARGSLGKWTWVDTGVSIFKLPPFEVQNNQWPPLRDRGAIKQSGCLQLDRHSSHSPVFLEARCERKMQFICYQPVQSRRTLTAPSSDDTHVYILVQQKFYWQHAYENCRQMRGTLASVDNNDVLIQLLLAMGENKELPVEHIWVSGRLNMTRNGSADHITYVWYNPNNDKVIQDSKRTVENKTFMPPWLDVEPTLDAPCLNLDRVEHLTGLLYGLACDTPQYSICMIEKPAPAQASYIESTTVKLESVENTY